MDNQLHFTIRWAFAVLIFEVFTMGLAPYPGMSIQEVIAFVTAGMVMSKPNEIPTKIYQIMLRCWSQSPEERPTFAELVQVLSEAIGRAEEVVYRLIYKITYTR